jgi:voltage-gated potassium channel
MPDQRTGLAGHYIVCGFGRVGREVADSLHHSGRIVVAVDADAHQFAGTRQTHTVTGNATDDSVLMSAGVNRASGLVAATGSDATNLSIALSAHALNTQLRIVARANQGGSEAKLLRAGATRVVSPYAIGARRMTTQLVSPGVVAFLDAIRDAEQVDLCIEETTIAAGSSLIGQTVREAIPRVPGLPNLIAIRRGGSAHYVANPPPDLPLSSGDTLIVVGSRAHLAGLIARAASRPPLPTAGQINRSGHDLTRS